MTLKYFRMYHVLIYNLLNNYRLISFFRILTHRAELGFIPHSNWCKKMIKFSKLQRLYFQRRKGHARRFDYKLYNALLITKKDKNMFNLVGAMWVTADIIKINSEIFAQLIGINTIQGGLFHKQGNFPRNGFIHIYKNSSQELIDNPDCVDVDEHNVRLFIDKYRRFTRDKDYVVFEDIIIP